MATTTPNYGWTVPTSTDLVKDGATAIETLGDAIDASMNTALGTKKAGMVLLNTTSFSGVASQSFNDVFSSTYANYRIIYTGDSSAASGIALGFRFRVSGSDITDTNYFVGTLIRSSAAATTSIDQSNANNAQLLWVAGVGHSVSIDFLKPNLNERTLFNGTGTGLNASLGSQYAGFFIGGAYAGSTLVSTGFSILPASGTITGTVRVYGYNN